MNDFFDYLHWRGDLTFSESPFNDVDALIFSQLVYLNFDGLVSEKFSEKIKLSSLSKKFQNSTDFETRKNLGMLINPKTIDLLFACASSDRFGIVELSAYFNKYSLKSEEQFCAVTFSFDGMNFVSFRGTDDTIVGWKEDFNLAFLEKVPAQEDALFYLKKIIPETEPQSKVFVGGHSKGGNLAIYAAAKLSPQEKGRLAFVYNFDGPGFLTETLFSEEFKSIEKNVKSVYPQFSVIGMLFHHFSKYTVAKSNEKLLFQHDPFSWGLEPKNFDALKSLDIDSRRFHKIFNNWFEKLPEKDRIELVETVFDVIESSEAESLSEISENWKESLVKIVKAISNLKKDIKKSATHTIFLLFREAFPALPTMPSLKKIEGKKSG